MTVVRGPEDLRRRADEGDEGAQLELGQWYADNGHLRQALKCLAPLAKAGNGRALEQITAVMISLARSDSRYRPSTEALLRSRAERQGPGFLLALAHEMRSWTGRALDA